MWQILLDVKNLEIHDRQNLTQIIARKLIMSNNS